MFTYDQLGNSNFNDAKCLLGISIYVGSNDCKGLIVIDDGKESKSAVFDEVESFHSVITIGTNIFVCGIGKSEETGLRTSSLMSIDMDLNVKASKTYANSKLIKLVSYEDYIYTISNVDSGNYYINRHLPESLVSVNMSLISVTPYNQLNDIIVNMHGVYVVGTSANYNNRVYSSVNKVRGLVIRLDHYLNIRRTVKVSPNDMAETCGASINAICATANGNIICVGKTAKSRYTKVGVVFHLTKELDPIKTRIDLKNEVSEFTNVLSNEHTTIISGHKYVEAYQREYVIDYNLNTEMSIDKPKSDIFTIAKIIDTGYTLLLVGWIVTADIRERAVAYEMIKCTDDEVVLD